MIAQQHIRAYARRLAKEFKPEKIILFGSYACGNPSSVSDVDLLIIMPLRKRGVYQAAEIQTRLRPHFPLDLLVRSPAKVNKRLALGDCFMREIMSKGRLLYEAPHS
ncbi:MAG: nucleotidyltransferase domain-containing protein [Kiritimatiellia bacterium]|nr:nucleotidyltransferase domain-containing protein [Kiritimatiellia bacterium]